MGPLARLAAAVVAGYLLGSVPVADIVSRRHDGGDLRTLGDRNPGYWNARSALGERAAAVVFAGDAAKGAMAAAAGRLLVIGHGTQWWVAYAAGFAAMAGHAWPVFARFRGGRAVATFAGAACVLSPIAAAISVGALALVALTTRRAARGVLAGVFGFPVVQLFVDGPYRTVATGALMCLIGLRFAQAARADRTRALATPDAGGGRSGRGG